MTMNLDDLFNEREAELRAEHEAREACKKAEWDALTPEEQRAALDAREARLAAFYDAADAACPECGEGDCDCEDEFCDGCNMYADDCECDEGEDQ